MECNEQKHWMFPNRKANDNMKESLYFNEHSNNDDFIGIDEWNGNKIIALEAYNESRFIYRDANLNDSWIGELRRW